MRQDVQMNRKVTDAKLNGIVHQSIERIVTPIRDEDRGHLKHQPYFQGFHGLWEGYSPRIPQNTDPPLVQ